MRSYWLVLLGFGLLYAGEGFCGEPITFGTRFEIDSKHLGEKRAITIVIPESHQVDAGQRYPVLYCLDGESHFKAAAGTVGWLSGAAKAIPEVILAAIENTPGKRTYDMGAVANDSGRNAAFVKFLEEELVPHIDQAYPTQPFRVLFGHSLAGRFVVQMMARNKRVFQAYLAASPYFVIDNGSSIEKLPERLKAHKDEFTFLYASLGDEPGLQTHFEAFAKTLEASAPKRMVWKTMALPGEGHMTTPGPTLHRGLMALFKDQNLDPESETMKQGVAAIKAYYQRLSKEKYGYEVSPETAVTNFGLLTAQGGDLSGAIEILKANATAFPKSWQVHLSLSRVLEAGSQLALSLEAAEEARELAAYQDASVRQFLAQRVLSLKQRLQ